MSATEESFPVKLEDHMDTLGIPEGQPFHIYRGQNEVQSVEISGSQDAIQLKPKIGQFLQEKVNISTSSKRLDEHFPQVTELFLLIPPGDFLLFFFSLV